MMKRLNDRTISRRKFLRTCRNVILTSGIFSSLGKQLLAGQKMKPSFLNREAMFYKKLNGKTVKCEVCFRCCQISEGCTGFCRNKKNVDGKLYNLVHSRPSAIQVDPIEKEPCYHMLPGTNILCFGTAGCNFSCKFCQNWHLSQMSISELDYYQVPPEKAVEMALARGIPTISFTYNDPISFYEYVYDIAKLAKKNKLRILWHSNGTMNPEPLKELLKYTDAVTIDLKAFTEKFYRELSSARLQPCLDSLKLIKKQGVWLELVNLHIPTLNDDPKDVKRMCDWIVKNLGKETPLHFSRFFPAYRLTRLPPTPMKKLLAAYKIATDAGLEYVTLGNVPGHKYNSTFCPKCKKAVIKRTHFTVVSNNLKNGKCKYCQHPIPGRWG